MKWNTIPSHNLRLIVMTNTLGYVMHCLVYNSFSDKLVTMNMLGYTKYTYATDGK